MEIPSFHNVSQSECIPGDRQEPNHFNGTNNYCGTFYYPIAMVVVVGSSLGDGWWMFAYHRNLVWLVFIYYIKPLSIIDFVAVQNKQRGPVNNDPNNNVNDYVDLLKFDPGNKNACILIKLLNIFNK